MPHPPGGALPSGAAVLPISASTPERAHRGGEHLASVVVVAEHVEARARRRQQHGVARSRGRGCRPHRVQKRRRALGRAHPRKRGIERRRVLADQYHPANLAPQRRGERREILPLALAARDQHQGSFEAGDRRDGRADIGALRVIDVAHARDVRDEFRAMLEARKGLERAEHGGHRQSRRLAERKRSECVRNIVQARYLHARGVEQRLPAARQPSGASAARNREVGVGARNRERHDTRRNAHARALERRAAHGRDPSGRPRSAPRVAARAKMRALA